MNTSYEQNLALKIIEDFYTLDTEGVEKLLHTNFDYSRLFLNNLIEFGLIDRNVAVLKTEVGQEVKLYELVQETKDLKKRLKNPGYWFLFKRRRELKWVLTETNDHIDYIKKELSPTTIRGETYDTKSGLARVFSRLPEMTSQEEDFLEAIDKYYQKKVEEGIIILTKSS